MYLWPYQRNPDLEQNEKHDLQFINGKLWLCRGNCDHCDCSSVVRSALDSHHLRIKDVIDLPVMPERLRADAKHIKENRGEHVEEGEDYLDIRVCRPIPDSFWAVSDDEL